MNETINQAKAEYLQAKDRITHALLNTPDDRINWSPAPSARTPVQLVAHAAQAMAFIHQQLDGTPFEIPTTAEADRSFRDWEQQFCTREQALDVLERNGAAYVAWLDALTPERLQDNVKMPFGLGYAPVEIGLKFVPAHTHGHAAQIDYIQTIYGDQDWHL